MARMIPPEIFTDTKSPAEIYLFDRLKNELDDSWIVLHSVGIASPRTKPWAEIDFVCVGSSGIFCLEVKGGGISFKDGKWIQTNRHGEEFDAGNGPFQQVSAASTALHHYLRGQSLGSVNLRQTVIGSGVVTPDIAFTSIGPEIVKEIIYDSGDANRTFDIYLQRLGQYWHNHYGLMDNGQINHLTAIQIEQIVESIRPDFDFRPSLNHRMGKIEEQLVQLTREQIKILDMLDVDTNPRMLIRGGAGTGKTLCAVEVALHHARSGKRVLLSCFNRALAAQLKVMVADWESITVVNFHDFMEEIVMEAESNPTVDRSDLNRYYRTLLPEACQAAIIELNKVNFFDAVVLDEGQDLMLPDYMDILDVMLDGGIRDGNWSIFWDQNQDIYQGIDAEVLEMLRAPRPFEFRLSKNCRNTIQIAEVMSLLSGVPLEDSVETEGIHVDPQWYKDNKDQCRKISRYINRLLGERVDTTNIVIISPRRLENSSLSGGLDDVPYPLIWWEDTDNIGDESSGKRYIKYSTLHSFKGLESEVIILADVEDLEGDNSRYQLYVGSSRGRAIMAPFILETQRGIYELRAKDQVRK